MSTAFFDIILQNIILYPHITYHDVSHTLNSIEYVILLLYFVAITIVYTVSQSYIDIGGTMSKTAYIVRHINFENAGILESVLIDRGFELTYIEAPPCQL